MATSKAGSFSAYLAYAQRGASEAPSPATTPASLLVILNRLPAEGTSMSQLAELSGMSAVAFHEALKKLQDSGFVAITGQPLSELVQLTQKGLDAASLL